MTEERLKVLEILQDGKINAQDAARLLEALNKIPESVDEDIEVQVEKETEDKIEAQMDEDVKMKIKVKMNHGEDI